MNTSRDKVPLFMRPGIIFSESDIVSLSNPIDSRRYDIARGLRRSVMFRAPLEIVIGNSYR